MPSHRRGDRAYFRAIEEQLKAGGYEKLLHTLLTREIDRERLETPPVSQALVEQAVLSMSPAETWLHGLLASGEIRGKPYGVGQVRTHILQIVWNTNIGTPHCNTPSFKTNFFYLLLLIFPTF